MLEFNFPPKLSANPFWTKHSAHPTGPSRSKILEFSFHPIHQFGCGLNLEK
jgi:hypothetical protein